MRFNVTELTFHVIKATCFTVDRFARHTAIELSHAKQLYRSLNLRLPGVLRKLSAINYIYFISSLHRYALCMLHTPKTPGTIAQTRVTVISKLSVDDIMCRIKQQS